MSNGLLKIARDAVCRACEHNRWSTTWRCWRCKARGVGADHDATQELDNEYMGGPESNCPLGKWDGVVGLTEKELVAQRAEYCRQKAAERTIRWMPLFTRIGDAPAIGEALDEMVTMEKEEDRLDPDIALEMKKLLNAPTTITP